MFLNESMKLVLIRWYSVGGIRWKRRRYISCDDEYAVKLQTSAYALFMWPQGSTIISFRWAVHLLLHSKCMTPANRNSDLLCVFLTLFLTKKSAFRNACILKISSQGSFWLHPWGARCRRERQQCGGGAPDETKFPAVYHAKNKSVIGAVFLHPPAGKPIWSYNYQGILF